jgi:hypothetical protein
VAIGGTTPLAGTFTDLRVNNTISLAGSTGTAGYVLTSNGTSAPTWQANASGLGIVDDTTTNATRYITFTDATTGTITTENVSSTKLRYNPSTGTLSSTAFVGDGSGLTGVAGGQYFGTANPKAIAYNASTIAENITVTYPSMSVGPITINSGFAVTVNAGVRWLIL